MLLGFLWSVFVSGVSLVKWTHLGAWFHSHQHILLSFLALGVQASVV